MPIPKTRQELVHLIDTSYSQLMLELARVDAQTAEKRCSEEWTLRELLAARVWWTQAVLGWIETGSRKLPISLPKEGYSWKETPRLNAHVIHAARE